MHVGCEWVHRPWRWCLLLPTARQGIKKEVKKERKEEVKIEKELQRQEQAIMKEIQKEQVVGVPGPGQVAWIGAAEGPCGVV